MADKSTSKDEKNKPEVSTESAKKLSDDEAAEKERLEALKRERMLTDVGDQDRLVELGGDSGETES